MSRSYAAPPQGPSSAQRATAVRRAADAYAVPREGTGRHAGPGAAGVGTARRALARRRSRDSRPRRQGSGTDLHADRLRAVRRRRLFPRRRLRPRRSRHARSAVPPDRRPDRCGRVRGPLPAGARAPVPGGRRGRRIGRALVPGPRRGIRRRCAAPVHDGRQRRRHAGDGDRDGAARPAQPERARPGADLSDHRSRRSRLAVLRRLRRGLRPDPRRHALVHPALRRPIRPMPPIRVSARCGCRPCAASRRRSS